MVRRSVLIIFFILTILVQGIGQIRRGSLTVGAGEVFEILGTDILVVDTLILLDSSRIILNPLKRDNFIHAKKILAGRGSVIQGSGKRGNPGDSGLPAASSVGPCKDGFVGLLGKPGMAGDHAVNLFLYIDEIKITGSLIIDLAGGDGGDGGKGGRGSDGNSGTKLCQGGAGGNGGNGGAAGNGGNAGNLTIVSPFGTDLRNRLSDKLTVRSYGGFSGLGGDGGLPGSLGLGPKKDGESGRKGSPGPEGVPGKPGGVFFERK